jgi:PPM family protein phosphatase
MSEEELLIGSDTQQIPYAYLSHRGRVRQNNEDRLAVCNLDTVEKPFRHRLLAVLSDGVGGHRAGEIAAQIGIESVMKYFSESSSLADPVVALREGVEAANLAVLNAGAGSEKLEEMDATCICVLIIDKTLYIASLGDSRAYLIRRRIIRQLNYDHTFLEEINGISIPDMKGISRNHPLAHVLSRYLGSAHPAAVDLRIRSDDKIAQKSTQTPGKLNLQKGDRILLCSDGLTDMLTDKEIRVGIKGKELKKAVQQLVLCALEKGGHDNVSVILIEVP